jgi:DNA repair exonuclease SbcCD nuclease subunit
MIKKIIHTADWHLEPYKNHQKFLEAIDSFENSIISEVGDISSEEVRIVIVGDLFDNRTKEPSNEAFVIMMNTLKRLLDKFKIIITIGNHDYDTHNRQKMDCITPVVEALKLYKPDNITFLKKSCIHIDENIAFCNYSNFDVNHRPEIEISLKENPNKTHIGLFHDVIQGAVNFNQYNFTVHHDHTEKVDIFEGCDFVMMGDIHKHQTLKYKVPVVYCGSLYQLNYGETIEGHGYVLWDVKKRSFEFKEVKNNYGLYKVTFDSFEDAIIGNFKFTN